MDYLQKEWNVIGWLLRGAKRKEAARHEKVSLSFVAKAKARYPLFFWKTHRRYKKLPGKF